MLSMKTFVYLSVTGIHLIIHSIQLFNRFSQTVSERQTVNLSVSQSVSQSAKQIACQTESQTQ